MPSGCARIPTSSIFITTFRPQLHFHLATSDQRIGVMRKLVLTFSSMVGAPIPFSAFAAALKVALSASVDSRPHDGAYLMNPRRVTSWSGGARPGLSQKGGLPSRRGADCGPRPSTRAPRGSDCYPCAVLRATRAGATLSLAALFLPGPGSGELKSDGGPLLRP